MTSTYWRSNGADQRAGLAGFDQLLACALFCMEFEKTSNLNTEVTGFKVHISIKKATDNPLISELNKHLNSSINTLPSYSYRKILNFVVLEIIGKKESHLETNAYFEINHIYGCGH
ncbi:hypothetical protein [Planococcus salinus]|uniref:Uncharacterized protein n=1 Tax=Planococcus salinus TaxID=1848460 RepID=A0A3M8PEK9_9BACL|nr:hypothetical protein [Planococcus salinus]RNF41234.1 hypothetical protein EEX84_02490 [Planococcus salinus]